MSSIKPMTPSGDAKSGTKEKGLWLPKKYAREHTRHTIVRKTRPPPEGVAVKCELRELGWSKKLRLSHGKIDLRNDHEKKSESRMMKNESINRKKQSSN